MVQVTQVSDPMDPNRPIQNPEDVEAQWAVNAVRYAETFAAILERVSDPRKLRLTSIDDEIYEHFRRVFPDLNVAELSEDILKSSAAKELWRPFCDAYKDKLPDHNVGTLMRARPSGGFTEENTILAPRVQFYAIELARCREGHNDRLSSS